VCRIGIWDSGVGGLSVLRHCRALMPRAAFHYFADRAHAPYGARDAASVRARARAIAALLEQDLGCDALVIACNTATALAAEEVRGSARVPVVALEPGVKPALALTRSGAVAVLATAHTLASPRFAHLVERHAGHLRVLPAPAPGLVELIESGDFDGPAVRACLDAALGPALVAGADVIILGCTHYPWVAEAVRAVAGPAIPLVDTGPAVARHLRHRLTLAGVHRRPQMVDGASGQHFWCSGPPSALPGPIRLALGLPETTRFETWPSESSF
jgi:glutamate racemase